MPACTSCRITITNTTSAPPTSAPPTPPTPALSCPEGYEQTDLQKSAAYPACGGGATPCMVGESCPVSELVGGQRAPAAAGLRNCLARHCPVSDGTCTMCEGHVARTGKPCCKCLTENGQCTASLDGKSCEVHSCQPPWEPGPPAVCGKHDYAKSFSRHNCSEDTCMCRTRLHVVPQVLHPLDPDGTCGRHWPCIGTRRPKHV